MGAKVQRWMVAFVECAKDIRRCNSGSIIDEEHRQGWKSDNRAQVFTDAARGKRCALGCAMQAHGQIGAKGKPHRGELL